MEHSHGCNDAAGTDFRLRAGPTAIHVPGDGDFGTVIHTGDAIPGFRARSGAGGRVGVGDFGWRTATGGSTDKHDKRKNYGQRFFHLLFLHFNIIIEML